MNKDKKIKVYLQYPWKFPDSPYYKYLIDSPPNNVKFLNINKQKGVITNKNFFLFSTFLKKIIRGTIKKLNLSIINTHKTNFNENYDLIHCAHCLSKNKNMPWIADFEGVWQMFVSGEKTKQSINKARNILINKNCKKIIAWTERTKEEFKKYFPEIYHKLEVVYPAVPIPKFIKNKNDKVVLIFIGRYFHGKGGLDTLKVFNSLTQKYSNIECLFVSETPKKIIEKYSSNKRIKFFELMPQERLLKEIYANADILVYPGYSDTFGFALIEAMSFGIPVVSVQGMAREEIIEDGKTGFIIPRLKNNSILNHNLFEKRKIIENLINKTSLLIEDSKLRKKMSINCKEIIETGKFSIKKRNEKLQSIYEEVIR